MKFTFAIGLLLIQLPLAADPDLGDHANFAHAMKVETRMVDGAPVVFQYGEARPDFEASEGNEWRSRTNLNGDWQFRFEGQKEERVVQVPHNWEAMEESKFWDQDDTTFENPARFNGAGHYRRVLFCDKKEDRRYRLEFGGVRERARVWVNGKEVAQHEGLGASFSVEVTDELVSGENEVRVKVLRLANHRKGEDGKWREIEGIHTPYPKAPDYWPYAGMTGSVALWEESEVTIRKVQVRTEGNELKGRVVISNRSAKKQEGKITLASSALADGTFERQVSLEPESVRVLEFSKTLDSQAGRWSPAEPNLHQLQIRFHGAGEIADGTELRFGLREFGVQGEQLVLNGEPIFLKGVAAYCETEKGAAISREEQREILALAKEAGANFVRLPVRQCDPVVYQLADEMGLMLTGEWGGFWYKEKSMDAQTRDPFSIFQSMGRVAVWDLMNRPSVVLWCTNNECHQFCPEYELFVKMNRSLVREIDGGMLPVTWAAWHPHFGEPHFEWADVVGFNEYRGAMDSFDDLEPDMKLVREQNPGKPIIIMENGSWAELGRRGKKGQRGTEDWQADLLRRQWEVLRQHTPPLAGYTFWTLKDYRSRKTYTGNRKANGWSGMGMYSEGYKPKMARDVFRELDFTRE
ncbi:sugar-binding domain-containing protein [Roseibacillus persicicus]|uniref:glycoside hydrolase family 2 protein n=1 Tax=Roseibacillus persicicus TaxID=454148 RepID=UPI00398B8256